MSTTPTPPTLDEAAARWRALPLKDQAYIVAEAKEQLVAEDNSSTPMVPAYDAFVSLLEAASAKPKQVAAPTASVTAISYDGLGDALSQVLSAAITERIPNPSDFMLGFVLSEVERLAAKAADCDRFSESDIYALTVSLGKLRAEAQSAYERECTPRGSAPHDPSPTT